MTLPQGEFLLVLLCAWARPTPQHLRGKGPPGPPLQRTEKVSTGCWMGFFRGAAMGPGLILPGTLLLMVLLVPPMVCGIEERLKPTGAALFLLQEKFECHLANGTAGEVRYLRRYFYDRQEIVRFDSRRGEYEALAPLGEPDAQYWNGQKEELDYRRGEADRYCRHNYGVYRDFLRTRRVEPTVKISHTKAGRLAHHSLLICTAAGYYPSGVTIKWLKNGEEQTEGVGYADEFQNGDWTFQDQVLLETVPQRGDVYACQVEHSSLKEPLTVQWEPRSLNSARGKVWTGAVGAMLGVVLGAAGVSFYLRTRRASPAAPAVGLIG